MGCLHCIYSLLYFVPGLTVKNRDAMCALASCGAWKQLTGHVLHLLATSHGSVPRNFLLNLAGLFYKVVGSFFAVALSHSKPMMSSEISTVLQQQI